MVVVFFPSPCNMVAVQSYVYTLFLCFAALPVLAQEVLHDGKTYVKADNFGFTLNLVSGLEEAPLEARSPGALGDAVLEKRQGSRCINPLWGMAILISPLPDTLS